MPARYFLQHNWPAITISVTAVAIGCAAIVMLRNMPPHRIVMATGPEGDAYYEVGERYRAALARENVEVQLVPTAGSVENLTKLLDPRSGASVGLIEGGLTPAGYAQQLARNHDPDLASQLAADIAGEAAGLDRRIGGFLAKKRNAEDAGTRVNAATFSKSER